MTMNTLKLTICAAALSVGFGMAASTAANAQAAVMKECGDEYSSAKIGGTLAGKTWPQYLSECKLRKTQPAPTPVTAPAPAPAPVPPIVAAPKPVPPLTPVTPPPIAVAPVALPPVATTTVAPEVNPKPRTAGQQAFYERERKCGAYWKTNKVALKAQTPGLTWPKFLSSCNEQLKAANQ